MKKYMLLGNDTGLIESNFALVVINASKCGRLDNLVVLKQDSETCKKLNDDMGYITIVDKYKNYLTDKMELVKIKEEDIECEYLLYLSEHNMDGSRIKSDTDLSNCCNKPVIENTDLCSDCKEHSEVKYQNKKKENWIKDTKTKSLIASVSNIFLDTFDIIESRDEAGLITFLADNGVHTFKNATIIIKEFVEQYGYRLLPRSNIYIDFDNLEKTEDLSDDVGKFAIIKDEEKYSKSLTSKPITVYAIKDDVGYIVGSQGRNIKRLVRDFNLTNKKWLVPYINVKPIEERTTNNSMEEIKDSYYELLKIIFK